MILTIDGDEETFEVTEPVIEKQVQHLNRSERRRVTNSLMKNNIIAYSLDDLRPSTVPVQH